MSNEVAIFEGQLKQVVPQLQQALAGTLPVDRLMRTLLISVEKMPKLLECDRQTLFNAAMSAAVLGLEVDGVTGQAFLIPFKNRVQLVIGYKGFNTIAARSGMTVRGGVVREGDSFKYDLATAQVSHILGEKQPPNARIIYAWALAVSNQRPAILSVLTREDLDAIKAKSPGAQRSDSPWNDPAIGFAAMCEKSAKRRLARSMPLNIFQWAARMEEAFDEQGLPGHITPDGPQIGSFPPDATETPPDAKQILERSPPQRPTPGGEPPAPDGVPSPPPGGAGTPTFREYEETWKKIISDRRVSSRDMVERWKSEAALRDLIKWPTSDDRIALMAKVKTGIANKKDKQK